MKEQLRDSHYQECDWDARVEYYEEDHSHEDHPEVSGEIPMREVARAYNHREDVHWRDQDVEDDDAWRDHQDQEEGTCEQEQEAT